MLIARSRNLGQTAHRRLGSIKLFFGLILLLLNLPLTSMAQERCEDFFTQTQKNGSDQLSKTLDETIEVTDSQWLKNLRTRADSLSSAESRSMIESELSRIFTHYRFDANARRLDFDVVIDRPTEEQVVALLQTFMLYQPPYSDRAFTLDEFLFRYHLLTDTYRKPESIPLMLKFLSVRVKAPTKHDIVFAYVAGRIESPLWSNLKMDVEMLLKDDFN